MAGRITKNELNQSLKNEIESKANQLDLESLAENQEEFDSHLAQDVTDGDNPHGIIYEEGVLVPELRIGGSASGITYSIQNGKYIRNGNNVVVEFEILLTSKGTQTGAVTITGIPFSTNPNAPRVAFTIGEIRNITLGNQENVSGSIAVNSSTILLNYNRSGLTIRSMTDSDITNNSRITAVFTYNL